MIVYIFKITDDVLSAKHDGMSARTKGLFVSLSDLSLDAYSDYFVRYGFAKSEFLDVPVFLSVIGDARQHALLSEVAWFSKNIIEPLASVVADKTPPAVLNDVILNSEFYDAVEACKSLVALPHDQEIETGLWIYRALSNLTKLSASRSQTNPETWPTEYLSLDTMSMATFRKRHKIESTALEPPTLTETKRRNAAAVANGGPRKRKRQSYQMSSQENVYSVCLADVREIVRARVAAFVVESSKFTLSDILLHGVPDGDMWWFKHQGLILSKQDTPFVKCPIDNTSAETIETTYAAVCAMSQQLCLKPMFSRSAVASENYEHVDYYARIVLLSEFTDAIRHMLYPVDFEYATPLAAVIEAAINHKSIDILTGRGDLCCLCYLPAKSSIVDGSESVRECFAQQYALLSGTSKIDSQNGLKSLTASNIGLTAEPSNYLCFFNFDPTAATPMSMKRSIVSYYIGDRVPDSTLYTVFANCIQTADTRFTGFLVIVGQVYVEYLHGLEDDGAWSQFCQHFSPAAVTTDTTARKKRVTTKPQQQQQTFTAAMQLKKSQIDEFLAPTSSETSTNASEIPASAESTSSNVSSGSVDASGSPGTTKPKLEWRRRHASPGQLIIVNHRSPFRIQPVFSDGNNIALCAELEYYRFSYLSALEHEDRTKSLLSTNVRVRVNKQVSNGLEWTASCVLTSAWQARGTKFHPYTVHTQAGEPIYYQHLPSRVVDELRGVRLYTDMYAILDQPK